MATTMKLIAKIVLGSDTASVTFGSGGTLPQTYTDLLLVCSARTSDSGAATRYLQAVFNGSTTGYTYRRLFGTGSAVGSDTNATFPGQLLGYIGTAAQTSSTFSSTEAYILRYTAATMKSVSSTSNNENNGSAAYMSAVSGLWSTTDSITSITISAEVGNLVSGSSFFLYGITNASGSIPGVFGVDATGGDVAISGGFKTHVFRSSGVLTVAQPGWAEVLVVGGGGGGGFEAGGGGGAGGVLTSSRYVAPAPTLWR